jgi:hypothetical protein
LFADVRLPYDNDRMLDFTVPDYISDPPIDWPHFDRDGVARRWLKDLGSDVRRPEYWTSGPPNVTGLLAARLGTSEEDIVSILHEGFVQHAMNRNIAETFGPVPHEIEARQQFIRLQAKTRSLRTRSDRPGPIIHPAHCDLDLVRRELADCPQVVEEWNDWAATWAVLVARNPPLELRQRMGEVFDTDYFVHWGIGRERLLYDWLARGTRDPMPFRDMRGIITEAYYKRLCELRDLSKGWFYDRRDAGIVFVSIAEWEAISATWPRVLDQVCAAQRTETGP